MFAILLKSVIIGGLAGFAFSVGAARMFHAPTVQAMGAFRTLGEMNACKGDSVAHLSFGASFVAPVAVAVVSSGGVGQDIWHRIVPNFAAGLLLLRNKDPEKTFQNPYAMGSVGAVVGALMMVFFMSVASIIPAKMAIIYGGVAQMVMGNAVPGCVMGILIGKAVEIDGWRKSTYAMVGMVTTIFVIIAYFRGFFTTVAKLFGI